MWKIWLIVSLRFPLENDNNTVTFAAFWRENFKQSMEYDVLNHPISVAQREIHVLRHWGSVNSACMFSMAFPNDGKWMKLLCAVYSIKKLWHRIICDGYSHIMEGNSFPDEAAVSTAAKGKWNACKKMSNTHAVNNKCMYRLLLQFVYYSSALLIEFDVTKNGFLKTHRSRSWLAFWYANSISLSLPS